MTLLRLAAQVARWGAVSVGLSTAVAGQQADTIVKVVETPRHAGVASVLEELSIGVLEGSPEYSFWFVTDVAIGQDGSMLILDAPFAGRASLRLYNGSGLFVRNVGGEGRGPGEFMKPAAVAVLPDGRFLLLDHMNRRINVYTAAGDYADTWTVPFFNVIGGVAGQMRVDPATGTVAIRSYLAAPGVRMQPYNPGSPPRQAVVRMRPGGAVIDTLDAPELPNLYRGVAKIEQRGSTRLGSGFAMPYIPAAFWQYSPLGYFVTGISSRYAIDIRVPRRQATTSAQPPTWRPGDPVQSIRLGVPPVRITALERAEQKAHIQNQLNALRGNQEGRVLDTPSTKPFFRSIYVGDDGRIWVTIHTPSTRDAAPQSTGTAVSQLRWREPTVLDVFEPTGSYVGRVRVPDDLRIIKLRDDRIWGVARDEFDVEYVKRYRVRWR